VAVAGEGGNQEKMVAALGAARGWRRDNAKKKMVAARKGATTPRVSAAKKSSSDYHVSGERLPRNWMVVLSHKGYNI
jgi:hypothetical protein